MKRAISKNVSLRLRIIKEDMRELQRQMTHKSVYAKQYLYTRRPKHVKRAFDNNYY